MAGKRRRLTIGERAQLSALTEAAFAEQTKKHRKTDWKLPKVLCQCQCGKLVTTKTQRLHLRQKHSDSNSASTTAQQAASGSHLDIAASVIRLPERTAAGASSNGIADLGPTLSGNSSHPQASFGSGTSSRDEVDVPGDPPGATGHDNYINPSQHGDEVQFDLDPEAPVPALVFADENTDGIIDRVWRMDSMDDLTAERAERLRMLALDDDDDDNNEFPQPDDNDDTENSNPGSEEVEEEGPAHNEASNADELYETFDPWTPELYRETGVLTARDRLRENFERRMLTIGTYLFISYYFLSDVNPVTVSRLDPAQMHAIRAFNYKVETLQKDSAYNKLPLAFPTLSKDWMSLERLSSTISNLTGLKIIPIDCCRNSCHAYTGPYTRLLTCVYCQSPRYDASGAPIKQFHYIPLAWRLVNEFKSLERIEELMYRSHRTHTPGMIADIFDGKLYRELIERYIEVNGRCTSSKYFEDPRDIALGISFDGFCPFKRRSATCWPIIAFNYNLPPSTRFHRENVIPLGTIPGPKQMKDADSFLLPFVEEMLSLAKGIIAFDASAKENFILRAHVITAFGDIPAAAKLMRMKGHNSLYPCRMCSIRGIRSQSSNSRSTTLYVPLLRPDGRSLDPRYLPMRSPEEFLRQAKAVSEAADGTEEDRLSKECGIKGIPVLSMLPSLTFPYSFPADFMHVAYENVLPELLDLWVGSYKDFDTGVEEYDLAPAVIKAIGEAVQHSGGMIPSHFGCRVPNPFTDRSHYTAEAWSLWSLMLAPILLRNRFKEDKYYVHFMKLIELLNVCLQDCINASELDMLDKGFATWVAEFEECVYSLSLFSADTYILIQPIF